MERPEEVRRMKKMMERVTAARLNFAAYAGTKRREWRRDIHGLCGPLLGSGGRSLCSSRDDCRENARVMAEAGCVRWRRLRMCDEEEGW